MTPDGDAKRKPSYPGEPRAKHGGTAASTWVKVAMAVGYFLCVSVAAFVLVIYYALFWKPGGSDGPNRTQCVPGQG